MSIEDHINEQLKKIKYKNEKLVKFRILIVARKDGRNMVGNHGFALSYDVR